VLAKLYSIRDKSLTGWEEAAGNRDAKAVVALATSLEKALCTIKQQRNIDAIRGVDTGEVRITIAGLDPSAFEFAPPLTQGDEQ
jgi:hypothetical protein